MNAKVKRETTVVGDIAPSGHNSLGVRNDLDLKQTRERNKKRKKTNRAGKQTGQPKEFEKIESLKLVDILKLI